MVCAYSKFCGPFWDLAQGEKLINGGFVRVKATLIGSHTALEKWKKMVRNYIRELVVA
jgi:hypothetical protein